MINKNNDWISIDDSLPDEYEAFLVSDGKYVNIAEFNQGEFLPIANCVLVNVTHWRELPQLPGKNEL